MRLLALLGLQQTEMTDFPYPSIILQLFNFLPFHIPEKDTLSCRASSYRSTPGHLGPVGTA